MSGYPRGSVVILSVVFTNSSGVALDPSTVALEVRDPAGAITVYTYAGAQIVKDSVGHYHMDLPVPTSGTWVYRFEATATGASATLDQSFKVASSVF